MHVNNAEAKVKVYNKDFQGFNLITKTINSLEQTSKKLTYKIKDYLNENNYSKRDLSNINSQLIALEKSFISDQGMYFGSWYRSLYASSDPFSGYAAWILPGLEYEIALKSSDRLQEWDIKYSDALDLLNKKMLNLIDRLN